MQHILDAIQAGQTGDATSQDFANLALPESYRAVTVHKDEVDMFEGLASRDKDPRKSLHVEDVALPELGPGEAFVAVMASAINYNTVWTSIFEPVSTFGFLERYGRLSELTKRHDLPYHVVGSDLAGVVLKTGPGVTQWKPGAEVVAHCLSVELEDPAGHDDTMMDPQQRIWGFETNFGGLATIALVKSNQLPSMVEELHQIRTSNFNHVTGMIQSRIDDGKLEDVPAYFHYCAAWALVHGLAMLILDRRIEWDEAKVAEVVGLTFGGVG